MTKIFEDASYIEVSSITIMPLLHEKYLTDRHNAFQHSYVQKCVWMFFVFPLNASGFPVELFHSARNSKYTILVVRFIIKAIPLPSFKLCKRARRKKPPICVQNLQARIFEWAPIWKRAPPMHTHSCGSGFLELRRDVDTWLANTAHRFDQRLIWPFNRVSMFLPH